jgi:hypothetical protein
MLTPCVWCPILGVLLVSVSVMVSCADAANDPCADVVCSPGSFCEPQVGICSAQVGDPAAVKEVGLWTSAALENDDELIVAAFDSVQESLLLLRYQQDSLVHSTHIDGGLYSQGGTMVGEYPAMRVAPDGQPRIAYYDRTHGRLKVAVSAGGAWSTQIVDDGEAGASDVGRWVRMVIDGNNGLHFAYRDETARQLRMLSMAPSGCKAVANKDNDSPFVPVLVGAPPGHPVAKEDYGTWPSIGITGDGTLLVSYYDAARGNLLLATCRGDTFSQQILDGEDVYTGQDTGDVGLWSSLAIDPDGNAGVAYYDRTRGVLRYARSYQGEIDIVVVDGGAPVAGSMGSFRRVGQYARLVFQETGEPRIAYTDVTNRAVLLARRSVFGDWTFVAVDALASDEGLGGIGLGLDLVVDSTDQAYLSYGVWSGDPAIGITLRVRTVPSKVSSP